MTAETDVAPARVDDIAARLHQAVADAFTAYTTDVQNQREDLFALTMSGLGGCSRAAAYRIARTEPSEPLVFREMREANIGTMMHLGLLPHLARFLAGEEEVAVTLREGGLVIKGRSDLYTERDKLVADLKTVGQYKFTALGETANRSHRLQVAGYALAVQQGGQEVEWVAWVYVDRSSGQDQIIAEPFGEELINLVRERCAELATYAENPEAAPRDERGPGLSIICDSCPWLRECWGADARPGEIGAQRILCHDQAAVAEALRLYDDARAREKEATADKEFARAMFSGFEPGAYGEFAFNWSAAGQAADKDAAVKLLADAGIPVPTKPTPRRLVVKRARGAP